MSAVPTHLLSRLRRHLRVVALLFVGLMVMKTGFATACAADSLANVPSAVASVSDAPLAASDESHSISVAGLASESCWHAGAGGCHCACVHVTPLQPQSQDLPTVAASSLRFTVALAAVRMAPRDDHLRPPIV